MMLAQVLFSDYRRRVLALLLLRPDEQFHVREIARLTQSLPGTLQRELAKLEAAGILQRVRVGNQVLYSADQTCPIFQELASILRKTSGLVDVLAAALQPVAERIVVAFVFGSAASGTAGSGSDIDVMVIGDGLGFGELVALLYPHQEALSREINPKLYGREEWHRLAFEGGAFFRDVMAKPKLFITGNADELGKLGENRSA